MIDSRRQAHVLAYDPQHVLLGRVRGKVVGSLQTEKERHLRGILIRFRRDRKGFPKLNQIAARHHSNNYTRILFIETLSHRSCKNFAHRHAQTPPIDRATVSRTSALRTGKHFRSYIPPADRTNKKTIFTSLARSHIPM